MFDQHTTIHDFLIAAAAKQPTPGGGSITALVGALATSMGEMVINYSLNKKGLELHQTQLQSSLHALENARKLFLSLMAEDQLAYAEATRLRKLPDDSAEKRDKYPIAVVASIRVPQAMAANAIAVLSLCDELAEKVNHFLLSDLAVCAELSMATLRCAIYNVRVNLLELTDPADRANIGQSIQELLSHGLEIIQRALPKILKSL